MKTNLCLVVAAALFIHANAVRAEEKPPAEVTDATAGAHLGDEVIVTAKVTKVSTSKGGTTFLNFGPNVPKQWLTGVIFASDLEAVGDVSGLAGKTVKLRGVVGASKLMKPEIVIKKASQLKVVEDAAPEKPPGAPEVEATTPTVPKPEAKMPEPKPAAPAPAQVVSAVTPALSVPAAPVPAGGEKKTIALAANWASATQGGEMTRKDLAKLFGSVTPAADATAAQGAIMVYPEVPYLTKVAVAKKTLKLEGANSTSVKVTAPGMPMGSFQAQSFTGIFPGGFSKLLLISDVADQVVSVLLLDEDARSRTPDTTDLDGYHTYNFVMGRVKGPRLKPVFS